MRSTYSGWQGHFSSKVLLLNQLFLSFSFSRKSKEVSWKAIYSSADQLLHHVMVMNRHNKQMDRSYWQFSHDVTKIQAKKLSLLLKFYFHGVLE